MADLEITRVAATSSGWDVDVILTPSASGVLRAAVQELASATREIPSPFEYSRDEIERSARWPESRRIARPTTTVFTLPLDASVRVAPEATDAFAERMQSQLEDRDLLGFGEEDEERDGWYVDELIGDQAGDMALLLGRAGLPRNTTNGAISGRACPPHDLDGCAGLAPRENICNGSCGVVLDVVAGGRELTESEAQELYDAGSSVGARALAENRGWLPRSK